MGIHRDMGRMPHEGEGRDWSDTAASRGHHRGLARQQELQEARKDPLCRFQTECGLLHSILGL